MFFHTIAIVQFLLLVFILPSVAKPAEEKSTCTKWTDVADSICDMSGEEETGASTPRGLVASKAEHRVLSDGVEFYGSQDAFDSATLGLNPVCENFSDSPVFAGGIVTCSVRTMDSSTTPNNCLNSMADGFSIACAVSGANLVILGTGFLSGGDTAASNAIGPNMFTENYDITFTGTAPTNVVSMDVFVTNSVTGTSTYSIQLFDTDDNIFASQEVGRGFVGLSSQTPIAKMRLASRESTLTENICFGFLCGPSMTPVPDGEKCCDLDLGLVGPECCQSTPFDPSVSSCCGDGSLVAGTDINCAPSGAPSVPPPPTGQPSKQPSGIPSSLPSSQPSAIPSGAPSSHPSAIPSALPSVQPSVIPSALPSSEPSAIPSALPSIIPSGSPSSRPSSTPSASPSGQPSSIPSGSPSDQPSGVPSSSPSSQPSGQPSSVPSSSPSSQPSSSPSLSPSSQPSDFPSSEPTRLTCDLGPVCSYEFLLQASTDDGSGGIILEAIETYFAVCEWHSNKDHYHQGCYPESLVKDVGPGQIIPGTKDREIVACGCCPDDGSTKIKGRTSVCDGALDCFAAGAVFSSGDLLLGSTSKKKSSKSSKKKANKKVKFETCIEGDVFMEENFYEPDDGEIVSCGGCPPDLII